MQSLNHCPCCQGVRLTSITGIVAPFIASYVLGEPPRVTDLLECEDCSFRFFRERFTAWQIEKLYGGYRGDRYLRERNRYEFWYTRTVNDSIGQSKKEIDTRKERLESFIGSYVPIPVESVLDYGGDSGQFIPDRVGRNKFVFEISGVKVVDGVQLIPSQEELAGKTFDLILLCHVLEHYSDPADGLRSVSAYLKPGQSKLLIELPYERYILNCLPKRGLLTSMYRCYLQWAVRSPFVLKGLDFISSALRVKFNIVFPFGFVKLHEHINFFNEKSIRTLLERSGYDLLACQTVKNESGGFRKVILCLAQLRSVG
jgi:SAM-dependent methyltransferase